MKLHQYDNFYYLLGALLFFLVLSPIIEQHLKEFGQLLNVIIFAAIPLVGVWSLTGDRKWFAFGASLAAIAVVLAIATVFVEYRVAEVIALIAILIFCVFATFVAIRQVLFSRRVTTNVLVGAVCVYLLLGIIWGLLYHFLDAVAPGSFEGVGVTATTDQFWDFNYFSFVTLTTLGYGDITPVGPIASTLSYLEAVIGQFYIAILVASLVGAHLAGQTSSSDSDRE